MSFKLDLPDDELILKMPENEGLVKDVVAELGLSAWLNAAGRKDENKVGLVELLTLRAAWVREQWLFHLKAGGTPLEFRENTPKKGEAVVMISNALALTSWRPRLVWCVPLRPG